MEVQLEVEEGGVVAHDRVVRSAGDVEEVLRYEVEEVAGQVVEGGRRVDERTAKEQDLVGVPGLFLPAQDPAIDHFVDPDLIDVAAGQEAV